MTTTEAMNADEVMTKASSARGNRLRAVLPALVLPALVLVVWQVASWVFAPREWILPSPTVIARTAWDDRARLWFHAEWTLLVSVLGLVLAIAIGCLLAFVIARSRVASLALYPWVIAVQTVPLVAMAPLFVLWMPGFAAMVTLAALISIFPVVVAGVDGLRASDPDLVRAVRALGADPAWVWWHVRTPAALPRLFTGIRMAAVFAVTGAVVGELVASDRGLGALTRLSAAQFETAVTFAAVACLALIGLLLFAAVAVAERLALPYLRRPTRPSSLRNR